MDGGIGPGTNTIVKTLQRSLLVHRNHSFGHQPFLTTNVQTIIAGLKKMNSEAAGGDTTLNKAPTETPSAASDELPLPSDPKTVFLGGLFILALLVAAYIAREIVLPLIFAFVLDLLLQPALRRKRQCASTFREETRQ